MDLDLDSKANPAVFPPGTTTSDGSGVQMPQPGSTLTAKRKAQALTDGSSSRHQKRRRKDNANGNLKDKAPVASLETSSIAPTRPHWTIVKPLTIRAKSKIHKPYVLGNPEIWASSRNDLLTAFNGLHKHVGGMSYLNFGVFPTFVWLLEGQCWPEDSWDGGTTIEVCAVVDVSGNTPPVRRDNRKKAVKGREFDDPSSSKIVDPQASEDEPLATSCSRITSTSRSTSHVPTFSESSPVPIWVRKECTCTRLNYQRDCPLCDGDLLRAASQSWPPNSVVPGESLWYPNHPMTNSPPHTVSEMIQPTCVFNESQQLPLLSHFPPAPTSRPPTPLRNAKWPSDDDVFDQFAETDISQSCKSTPGQVAPQTFDLDPVLKELVLSSASQAEGAAETQLLPVFSGISVPELVPEITTLLDCHKNKIPVVVIVSKDASIIPFEMPKEYAFVVLGFFDVASVEPELLKTTSEGDGEFIGTIRWKAKLAYSPTDVDDHGGRYNLKPPWWLPADSTASTPAEGKSDPAPSSPASILVESLEGVAERPWWHCTGCGKLNIRQMFLHRPCCHCSKVEDPAPAIGVEKARIGNKYSPDSFPFDDPPMTMELTEPRTWENNMRTFYYRYNDIGSVIIKHIFTCNLVTLQTEATDLFKRIQSDVELEWQNSSHIVSSGPYYTYNAAKEWVNVPDCITKARDSIINYARTYGEEPQAQINEVVVIAWKNIGSKKGSFVSAQHHPVFVLCLGADADFEIERKPNSAPFRNAVQTNQKGVKVQRTEAKIIVGKKRKNEKLRINMVHGDVLILRGDEFHYSLLRTGTTVLIFGFRSV